ncbi:MAG TPA: topoisomerase C-terminal repeat-containing protein, partial [Beijerinckiaceae bacterium]|nr:topoisomerase C-terminal repeat-containing protein [Beijerinckiaceae bacterium]
PYVNWGKVNANIPKAMAADDITLEQAIDLLRAREASGGGTKAKAPAKKPARKAAKKS